MKQKERQELLVALCGYLPYGIEYKDAHGYKKILDIWSHDFHTALNTILYDEKPSLYLRPMSSMTKKEALKLWDLLYSSYRRNKILEIIIKQECIDYILDDGVASTETFSIYYDNVVRTIDTFDWLNAHHFDFRNLIERGMALEAPKESD